MYVRYSPKINQEIDCTDYFGNKSFAFDITATPISAKSLYARYLCSRDALGLKAGRPSAARDERVSCIQAKSLPKFWQNWGLDQKSLYARYLCARDALGQARRATIGYLVYNKNPGPFISQEFSRLIVHLTRCISRIREIGEERRHEKYSAGSGRSECYKKTLI